MPQYAGKASDNAWWLHTKRNNEAKNAPNMLQVITLSMISHTQVFLSRNGRGNMQLCPFVIGSLPSTMLQDPIRTDGFRLSVPRPQHQHIDHHTQKDGYVVPQHPSTFSENNIADFQKQATN